jgi:hypothetical protein
LSRPTPIPTAEVLAMLIKTVSQKNLSNPAVKKSFEMELASSYKTYSKNSLSTVRATVSSKINIPKRRRVFYSMHNHMIDIYKVCSLHHVFFNLHHKNIQRINYMIGSCHP